MTKTMDLCNTGVGRRQKIGRGPTGEEFLFFAVNWDPLMCCIYLEFHAEDLMLLWMTNLDLAI